MLTEEKSDIADRVSVAAQSWARSDALDHRDPTAETGLMLDVLNELNHRRKRIAELEAALAGLLRLPSAIAEKDHLRKGVGSATRSGQAWLAAFKAAGMNLKD